MTSPALGGSVGVMSFLSPAGVFFNDFRPDRNRLGKSLKRKSRKYREISFRSRRTRKREVEVHFQGLTL